MKYTTDRLITSIKNRAFVPNSQTTFTDDDIIMFLNEELQGSIIPWIIKYNQSFFEKEIEVALEDDVREYKLPYRTAHRKLVDVYFKDASGNHINIVRVDRTQHELFNSSSSNPTGYYLEGDKVKLLPNQWSNANSRTLVYVIFMQSNEFVTDSNTRNITAIDTNTNTITINTVVPDFFEAGDLIDFIDHKAGYQIVGFDQEIASVDAPNSTITFTDTLPTDLVVGDHVCLAGETLVAPIPDEINPMLAEFAAYRIFEALNDTSRMQISLNRLNMMRQDLSNIVEDRITGVTEKAINRYSMTRSTGYGGYGRGRGRRGVSG